MHSTNFIPIKNFRKTKIDFSFLNNLIKFYPKKSSFVAKIHQKIPKFDEKWLKRAKNTYNFQNFNKEVYGYILWKEKYGNWPKEVYFSKRST